MKIATFRRFSKTRVNLSQDDTWGWELADLYVIHREIVTNEPVPNLKGGGQTNEKASLERQACCVDYSGPALMRMFAQFYSIFDANRRCFISSAVE